MQFLLGKVNAGIHVRVAFVWSGFWGGGYVYGEFRHEIVSSYRLFPTLRRYF